MIILFAAAIGGALGVIIIVLLILLLPVDNTYFKKERAIRISLNTCIDCKDDCNNCKYISGREILKILNSDSEVNFKDYRKDK